MSIHIDSTQLPDGRTRRVAIDSEAPDNPSTTGVGLFADLDPKAVALWDVRDVDGVRTGVFFMIRRDLQGMGYMKRLAPLMNELLGSIPLEMTNVLHPKIKALRRHLAEEGADVAIMSGPHVDS